MVSISIENNGQDHFFITTISNANGVPKVNYTFLSLNMLHPMSKKSEAKDILENLDIVVTWWGKIPPHEQRKREVMSKRRKQTPIEQH
jgi:hypothetical protein